MEKFTSWVGVLVAKPTMCVTTTSTIRQLTNVGWRGSLLSECRRRDPNAKCGGGEDFDENEAYDPKSNTWLTLAKLPSERQVFGAATDGSAAYCPVGTLRCGCLHCSTTCGMDIPRGRK